MKKRIMVICFVMCFSLLFSCSDDNKLLSSNDTPNKRDIVILVTGSTHGVESENIRYDEISKHKNKLKKDNYVALVDAGDFTAFYDSKNVEYGSKEEEELNKKKDEEIVKAENNFKKASYDFIGIGENEIYIGIDRVISLSKKFKNTFHCANLIDLKTNEKVFSSYKIMTFGNKKVAFISVVTPEIYTKDKFLFRDDEARYIYDLLYDKNGEKLCNEIQNTVKEVKEKNVNYIVLVGHLGTIPFSKICDYETIIENTSGIDVFIDGHSSSGDIKNLKNNLGKDVLFVQVAENLKSLGRVYISKNGSKSAQILKVLE